MAKYQRKSETPAIILYQDWYEIFAALSASEVGYIVMGIYAHRLGKEYESSGSPIVDSLLSFLNSQCDKNKETYIEMCNKNADKRRKKEPEQELTTVDDGQPQLTTVNHGQPQLTTVNHSQPQLTEVNDGQPQLTTVDLYKNKNNYKNKNKNKNDINISFSSNEEKGVEKETEKMSDQPDEETGKEVDPTRERGNPNFDLRRSYHEVMERKARERLEETGSKWLSDEYLAKNYPESFPHLTKQYNRPNIDTPNII